MLPPDSDDGPDFTIIGTQQSPIYIDPDEAVPAARGLKHLQFYYGDSLPGHYANQNFVIDLPRQRWGKLRLKEAGTDWYLRKIHMHNHVEHKVAGFDDPHYEFHLVHSAYEDEDAQGNKLVLGVFFRLREGAPRKEKLYRLNENLKQTRNANGAVDCSKLHGELDPNELLPGTNQDRADWFHYMGSLTSYPYQESVSWYVIRQEIAADPGDLDHIMQCACQDARKVFPLYRRFVLKNIIPREGGSPQNLAP
jgi:carbonic anhydrase